MVGRGKTPWRAIRADHRDFLYLQAHPMKRIAKAMLSRVTNMIAVRYEGVAFTRFIVYDSIWTRREALELDSGRSLLS